MPDQGLKLYFGNLKLASNSRTSSQKGKEEFKAVSTAFTQLTLAGTGHCPITDRSRDGCQNNKRSG